MPFHHPLVLLPTYNEAENLTPLVEEILGLSPNFNVLIVDDASPDGTGQIAQELATARPDRVGTLLRPGKQGLGRAYLAAFAEALRGPADAVFQMDADFSHPPTLLPLLLKELETADIVLGSRYVKGGGIQDWSWPRRLLSRGANGYARRILGIPIRDLTGGFKGLRRDVLRFLLEAPIQSLGYHFQIECTARALAADFTCREIPFTFTERTRGASKMSGNLIGEAFWNTWRLRAALRREGLCRAQGLRPTCSEGRK